MCGGGGGGGGGGGAKERRLDRGYRPKKTGETVDFRQNNGSIKAVFPRHCAATSAPRSCCFNCPECASSDMDLYIGLRKFRHGPICSWCFGELCISTISTGFVLGSALSVKNAYKC